MLDTMKSQGAVALLMRGQIYVREPQDIREAAPERRQDYSRYNACERAISRARLYG